MDIPEYIKNSDFYISLLNNKEEEKNIINDQIPEKFLNFFPSLKNKKDLIDLILFLAFWSINNIPYNFMDFIRSFINNDEAKVYLEDKLGENVYYQLIIEYIFLKNEDLKNYSVINNNIYLYNYIFHLIQKEYFYTPTLFEELDVAYIIIKSKKIDEILTDSKLAIFSENLKYLNDFINDWELKKFNNKNNIKSITKIEDYSVTPDYDYIKILYSNPTEINSTDTIKNLKDKTKNKFTTSEILELLSNLYLNSDVQIMTSEIFDECLIPFEKYGIYDSNSMVVKISESIKVTANFIFIYLFYNSTSNGRQLDLNINTLTDIKYNIPTKTLIFEF